MAIAKQTKVLRLTKLPADIDFLLQKKIRKYVKEKGSYAKLAQEMDEFVRASYKSVWDLVEEGLLTEDRLENHIKNHCPKRSYLNDYARGRSICFRYTNTIANFFNVKYSINNFSPSHDLQRTIELEP